MEKIGAGRAARAWQPAEIWQNLTVPRDGREPGCLAGATSAVCYPARVLWSARRIRAVFPRRMVMDSVFKVQVYARCASAVILLFILPGIV